MTDLQISSFLLYRDVCDTYAELELALEQHEPLAATAAAFDWWQALERLMQR